MSESIKKKIVGIPLVATMVTALALSVVVAGSSPTITPASAQLQCMPGTNPAGNSPPGQETCTCPPLTQCTEVVNPGGNTPPGKNK